VTWSRQRLWLTVRTARHLRATQVAHRVRLRTQRALLSRMGARIEAAVLRHVTVPTGSLRGWPDTFGSVAARLATGMPSPEANTTGRFSFLHHDRALGRPIEWHPGNASQLWRFHLHYFEWAWAFAAHPDRAWARAAFGDLWRSWQRHSPMGTGDAWAPYVVALRSWVLCGVFEALVAGGPDEAGFLAQLAVHGWFVRHHLERDVGGNHLIKDLKALIGFGVFLGDDRAVAEGRRELDRQVAIQVLGDGGHYERSPSYHCQVLEDLLDVQGLLGAAGLSGAETLAEPIGRMRAWLATMLLPDGDVPLFNDCALVGRQRLDLLGPGPAAPGRLVTLADSGYVVIRPGGRSHLVVDVGVACPPDLPAHAHADCLSFELAVDASRVVVDSGTSTYAAGPERDYERSTAAHNTVEIDGHSQIEVWGSFRVARRAQPAVELVSDDGSWVRLVASHDGYRRLPGRPVHRRRFDVSATAVTVTDEVVGTGRHRSVARVHLRTAVPALVEGSWRAGPLEVTVVPGPATVTQRPLSWSFGQTELGPCLELATEGRLPHRMSMSLRITEDPGTAEG
jgi:hypothetical protein